MKNGKAIMFGTLLGLLAAFNAHADFFGGGDCPPWEYDCNDWPEWTPMYWMEEFSNEWDNNDDDWYRYGGMGPYGMPGMMGPYGGYGMPYGGGYGMPGMTGPYGGGYGMPPMPYGPPPGYGPAPAPGYGPAPEPYGYGAPQGGQGQPQPRQ